MILKKTRQSFYDRIQEAQKKYSKLENKIKPKTAKKKTSFNLIQKLHIENKDVYENAHTRVLAGIFEYDAAFFESFLRRCGSYKGYVAKNQKKISVEVERQYIWDELENGWNPPKKGNTEESDFNGKSAKKKRRICRPDCLIWNKDQFAIVIENKINGACETEHQLDNYLQAVSNDPDIFTQPAKKNNIWIVYLGGDGVEMPSRRSLSDNAGKHYVIIDDEDPSIRRTEGIRLSLATYKDEIIPWLEEDVLPRCPYGDQGITGGLLVYIDYLKKRFSDDDSFYDSKEVVQIFQESSCLAPFCESFSEANRILGQQSPDVHYNLSFLQALKHYYLNHFFRFKNPDSHDKWTIRTNGHTIQVWKKSWEKSNKRQLSICDLFFEMYPYQVERLLVENQRAQTFTCRLIYKGSDEGLRARIDKGLQQNDCTKTGDYIYNKSSHKDKAFKPNLKNGFFDSFIIEPIITSMCSAIEKVMD